MTTERDRINQLVYARQEGKEEGLAEGEARGRKEGKEEGRKERALEIAKAFLENGVSIDIIAASTGLTEEEIKAL